MNETLKLETGDVVLCEKIPGILDHEGIVVGGMIFHNRPGKGEGDSSIAEFSGGRAVKVVKTGVPAAVVSRNIWKMRSAPQRYDLIDRNCQHTRTQALTGRAESPLVKLALGCAVIILLALVLLPRR